MSLLQQFLWENPVDNITNEVVISERFKDKDGKLMKFKIKAMTGAEFSEYQKASTAFGKKGKVEFNSRRFNEMVVINNTLEPSFKDAESLKQTGCQTPEQFLNKALLAGEINELAQQISALSGFDKDMEALRDEAKNS